MCWGDSYAKTALCLSKALFGHWDLDEVGLFRGSSVQGRPSAKVSLYQGGPALDCYVPQANSMAGWDLSGWLCVRMALFHGGSDLGWLWIGLSSGRIYAKIY